MQNREPREDMTYKVYWVDYRNDYHLEDVIANDHEDARSQIANRGHGFNETKEVLLVMKGDPLILWQA